MTVSRDDLEAKLRQIQEAIDETAAGVKSFPVLAAVGAAVVLLAVYLIGRRKGRKGSALVEVYRLR